MNNTLNEVKDRVYEAEGLLELLQLRPDKMAELAPLVRARLDEAVRLFAGITSDGPGSCARREETESAPAPTSVSETTVLAATVADDEPRQETEPEATESEEDELYSIDETVEPEPAEIKKESTDDSKAKTAGTKDTVAAKQSPAFCLNDRFRFRRTIFGGSDAEFNAAMNHIASLDNYEEAEEFFYGDMGLDSDDEDVADFMAVIKNYFGS